MALYFININGESKYFYTPPVGYSRTFGAGGDVLASAIERTSKSRYTLYCICKSCVICYPFNGFGAALDFLQELYNAN